MRSILAVHRHPPPARPADRRGRRAGDRGPAVLREPDDRRRCARSSPRSSRRSARRIGARRRRARSPPTVPPRLPPPCRPRPRPARPSPSGSLEPSATPRADRRPDPATRAHGPAGPPGRDPGRRPGAQHRPARDQGQRRLPVVQRRDVPAHGERRVEGRCSGSRARAGRRTSTPTPGTACSARSTSWRSPRTPRARCWGCWSRSTPATSSATCTRSATSGSTPKTLDAPLGATKEELWLQTSEGPAGTPGKTQLRAFPISVSDADPRESVPKARPVTCG